LNSFGLKFRFSTFGESHGAAIGCVVDGVPSGLAIDEEFIQSELDRRRPGQNEFSTARKESDSVEILSGVFEGFSTGTPIAMVIYNRDQKSKDYGSIKDLFRPAHADLTYFSKYGFRDYRGGGRSSARETAARVAAGALAKLLLREVGIEVASGVCAIDGIESSELLFEHAKSSDIYALDPSCEQAQKDAILQAKNDHDSVGGVVCVRASGVMAGLGEPLYHKLDAKLAEAMMGINAAKAVEIGSGAESARLKGSENNDAMRKSGFITNNAGGILGGMSSGAEIFMRVHFKPTPSIFREQQSVDLHGNEVEFSLKGRHDPCVAIRGSIVCEAMMALVLADMLLLNMSSKLSSVKSFYEAKI